MDSAQELTDSCQCCGALPAPHEHAGGKDEGDVWYYCDSCEAEHNRSRCSECGTLATTELADEHGELWPLCANCDVWWRETQAELADQSEAIRGLCQDCGREPATCRFLHLRKGTFYLCENCFGMADHEDDYLDYCDHAFPEGEAGDTYCSLCRRQLREPDAYCMCAAPVMKGLERINCQSCCGRIRFGARKPLPLCECPLPCTVDGDETYCFLCAGRVVRLMDSVADAALRGELLRREEARLAELEEEDH